MKKYFRKLLILATFSALLTPISYAEGVLQDKVIILDAGHGAGYNTYAGYCEGDTMLVIAKKLVPMLESAGATVYETRPDDYNVDLVERSAIINKLSLEYLIELENENISNGNIAEMIISTLNVDRMNELVGFMEEIIENNANASKYLNYPYLSSTEISDELFEIFQHQSNAYLSNELLVISLHSNASSLSSSNGGLVLFEPFDTSSGADFYYNDYAHVEQETLFANIILSELEKIGFSNGGYRAQNIHMTRENNLPTILVESGFHTNASDRELLTGDENLDKLATAYYNAIVAYYTSDLISAEVVFESSDYGNQVIVDKVLDVVDVVAPLASGNIFGTIKSLMDINLK